MTSAEFRRKMNLPPPGSHEHKTRPQLPNAKPAQRTPALVQDHEGEARGTGCPIVRFTLRRVRLFDADAKWSSVKDLLDGLQYAGLIQGDREDQIRLEVEQVKVDHYFQEVTEIELELQ